ncbi:hypothetical protein JZM24_00100 [Candidatus Sodalis endolongispinus]|uniref:DUF2158 domain-containing protein n=1 Tax=Candidatus Sodalis endolongispinus TaxID=2812662 RepID=A0ABS5Y7K4_9GAMM|nr:hypothetical protein [Candidatus Sodalis endolongispinus]MBT9430974.1 hypothetical protein [Candidatus Sodalis endolongispinus]
MTFATGDIVQPTKGGPAMSVVKVENDLVYCEMMDPGEEKSKAFKPQELTLYKEEGDFGVC